MGLNSQLEFDIAYKRYDELKKIREMFKEECDHHLARLEQESLILLEKMEDWQFKHLSKEGVK